MAYVKKKLSEREETVLDHYFDNDFHKMDAMIAAGYKKSTAKDQAARVFNQPLMVAAIAARRKALAKKHEVSQEWVISRLKARADAGRVLAKYKKVDEDGQLYWNFRGATQDELALVQACGVEFAKIGRGKNAIDITKAKVEVVDSHAALMALSRHLGLFNDKLEVSDGMTLAERIQQGRNQAAQEATEPDPGTVH